MTLIPKDYFGPRVQTGNADKRQSDCFVRKLSQALYT